MMTMINDDDDIDDDSDSADDDHNVYGGFELLAIVGVAIWLIKSSV